MVVSLVETLVEDSLKVAKHNTLEQLTEQSLLWEAILCDPCCHGNMGVLGPFGVFHVDGRVRNLQRPDFPSGVLSHRDQRSRAITRQGITRGPDLGHMSRETASTDWCTSCISTILLQLMAAVQGWVQRWQLVEADEWLIVLLWHSSWLSGTVGRR